MERAKAKGLDPMSDHVIRFKVERRVSSDDLMLTDVRTFVLIVVYVHTPPHTLTPHTRIWKPTHRQEEPVDAAEYRALLEAMMREQGDRSGYSFVKENADTEQPEVRALYD